MASHWYGAETGLRVGRIEGVERGRVNSSKGYLRHWRMWAGVFGALVRMSTELCRGNLGEEDDIRLINECSFWRPIPLPRRGINSRSVHALFTWEHARRVNACVRLCGVNLAPVLRESPRVPQRLTTRLMFTDRPLGKGAMLARQ